MVTIQSIQGKGPIFTFLATLSKQKQLYIHMLPTMFISIFMYRYSYGFQGCSSTHTAYKHILDQLHVAIDNKLSGCVGWWLAWQPQIPRDCYYGNCQCCVRITSLCLMKTGPAKSQWSIPVESCLYDMALAYGCSSDQKTLARSPQTVGESGECKLGEAKVFTWEH